MTPRPSDGLLAPLHDALDRVAGRVRRLWMLGGIARLVALGVAALVVMYAADRGLDLPVVPRAILLALLAAVLGREALRRLVRPVARGLSRLDAARLVERSDPSWQGRVVSALQLGEDRARLAGGSLERAVVDEARASIGSLDPDAVTTAAPAMREARVALAAVGVLVLGVLALDPPLHVFGQRLMLRDVSWPRLTTLRLSVPPRGPAHVVEDGVVVAVRGGVVDAGVAVEGRDPGRVELVVEGERGPRPLAMTARGERAYVAHVTVERGDEALYARGGDDDGEDTRLALSVVEPPRLESPRFELHPPAYVGEPVREVGPEGLVVPEGTRVVVSGVPVGELSTAELVFADRGERAPLTVDASTRPPRLVGEFVATASDTLQFALAGPRGLQTQDPAHHALLVEPDREPTLRVFTPSRSDVKVTGRAVVPFALIAEDDHAIESVVVQLEREGIEDPPLAFVRDPERPTFHRLIMDLQEGSYADSIRYRIEARDGRDLPGKGPQTAVVEGRRLDVVEDAEVERLLTDSQLRIKDAFDGMLERQRRLAGDVDAVLLDMPDFDEADLVAASVAQNQLTSRLERQARELCAVVDETLLNRLDEGPGAGAVLERRLAAFARLPVDRTWAPQVWRELGEAYAQGRFGRLDVVGRQLDMATLALDLSETLSPRAHEDLSRARAEPTRARVEAARESQQAVLDGLDALLQRMDEWEDYQEVLALVQALIDDQRSVRSRTHSALSGGSSDQ